MTEQVQSSRLEPRIAICNIYGEDATRLADFAYNLDFQGIEWCVAPDGTDIDLLKQIDLLRDFEVRYHMRWPGIEFAYADSRSKTALDLYRRKFELISMTGCSYITIHLGLGRIDCIELDWNKAITNLSRLVDAGAELGITVCLENLAANWTSKPEFFEQIVKQTGASTTLDIGHAHVCQMNHPEENIYEKYVQPNREKILNAHVYHTEIPRIGHIAPDDLSQINDRLSLLDSLPNCKWWVIELTKPDEILRTRRICQNFLVTSAKSPQLVAAN
jgi:sugar phosphate isomerase/epimerase